MNLEELKERWIFQNKDLEEQLLIDEDELQKGHLKKIQNVLNTPLYYEYITSLMLIGLILASPLIIMYIGPIEYVIPAILTVAMMGLWLSFSIHKITLLSNSSHSILPVVSMQKKLAQIEEKYLLYRKWEVGSAPLFFCFAFLGFGNYFNGMDYYTDWSSLVFLVSVALVLAVPSFLFGYKIWYDDKLKQAKAMMQEVLEFEGLGEDYV
ncbi:MAG: hypothetical protein AAF242_01950 [Bacteroidota bacterium]